MWHTEPSSMPTLASSMDGLTMTGNRSPSGTTGSCTSANGGTGTPAAWSSVLATCFRWQMVTGHDRHPVKGTRASSSAATT